MSKELIRLVNCQMAFDDEIVLDDINLYFNDKEFLTLLGPSGCGKNHHAQNNRRFYKTHRRRRAF